MLFKSQPKQTPSLKTELEKYLEDIFVMTSYACEQGLDIKKNNLSGRVSHLMNYRESIKDNSNFQNDEQIIKEAIEVHAELSSIIHPVTAISLNSTGLGFLKVNSVMRFTLTSTIISLILLLFCLFISGDDNSSIIDQQNTLMIYCKVFLAAWLGAGLYCLYTARKYLIDRTYQPRYNPTYTMRLILGVAMGTILGLFSDNFFGDDSELAKLGQIVLAIIGGFSSDAVASLFKRIADTIQSFVQGSDKDVIQKEVDKAKIDEKNKAVNLMLDVKNKMANGKLTDADLKTFTENIDSYVKS